MSAEDGRGCGLFFFLLLFLLLGLPLFFTGCNPDIVGQCYNGQDVVRGTVIGYHTKHAICATDDNNKFHCYSQYVVLAHGKDNQTCLYRTAYEYGLEEQIVDKAMKYHPLGQVMTVMHGTDVDHDRCFSTTQPRIRWTAGLVFFCLAALCVLLLVWDRVRVAARPSTPRPATAAYVECQAGVVVGDTVNTDVVACAV